MKELRRELRRRLMLLRRELHDRLRWRRLLRSLKYLEPEAALVLRGCERRWNRIERGWLIRPDSEECFERLLSLRHLLRIACVDSGAGAIYAYCDHGTRSRFFREPTPSWPVELLDSSLG